MVTTLTFALVIGLGQLIPPLKAATVVSFGGKTPAMGTIERRGVASPIADFKEKPLYVGDRIALTRGAATLKLRNGTKTVLTPKHASTKSPYIVRWTETAQEAKLRRDLGSYHAAVKKRSGGDLLIPGGANASASLFELRFADKSDWDAVVTLKRPSGTVVAPPQSVRIVGGRLLSQPIRDGLTALQTKSAATVFEIVVESETKIETIQFSILAPSDEAALTAELAKASAIQDAPPRLMALALALLKHKQFELAIDQLQGVLALLPTDATATKLLSALKEAGYGRNPQMPALD